MGKSGGLLPFMKALILNSGLGRRMGVLTSEHPKCMTEVSGRETILSRQLTQLAEKGIEEVVMTTGLFDTVLEEYCKSLELPLTITFVKIRFMIKPIIFILSIAPENTIGRSMFC